MNPLPQRPLEPTIQTWQLLVWYIFEDFNLISANAHIECLRDIGLEYDARKVAHPIAEYSTYHRICKTMAGEEFSRAYTFGNDPKRHVRNQS